jgi:hypothetical protein
MLIRINYSEGRTREIEISLERERNHDKEGNESCLRK